MTHEAIVSIKKGQKLFFGSSKLKCSLFGVYPVGHLLHKAHALIKIFGEIDSVNIESLEIRN